MPGFALNNNNNNEGSNTGGNNGSSSGGGHGGDVGGGDGGLSLDSQYLATISSMSELTTTRLNFAAALGAFQPDGDNTDRTKVVKGGGDEKGRVGKGERVNADTLRACKEVFKVRSTARARDGKGLR